MEKYNNIRYEALSRDWNQQRDKLKLHRLRIRRSWIIGGLLCWLIIFALVGCAAPLLPKVPEVGVRGVPDLHLEDGTPCWYIAAARHPLICNRRAP